MSSHIIYLAWGRAQRPHANLIQTLHTVEALTKLGARVRLYLPPVPRGFDLGRFLSDMGIRTTIDLCPAPSLHRRWRGWPFALLHRRELQTAGLVYTRVPELSLMLARLGIGHWLEVHDTATLQARAQLSALLAALARGTLRGLVAISAAGREALIRAGAVPEQVHVLPSGVDLEAFAAVPALNLDQLRMPRALYVGRISRDRGLPLFESLAAAGVALTLVGPRDHDPGNLHPNLELRPAVAHAQVPGVLTQGALALMPYQADLRHAATISPIKLFEALAAGRLVIASDLAPIREIIRDGVNGLLVPPEEPLAWLAAIRRVQADPAAALAIAEAGRQTAMRYGWDSRARHLLQLTGGGAIDTASAA
ncbi:MAG: glycosyltransferase family 4 protein [Proteobacteria bacterium]|nr:glycosyltransferase family 4 protein [Pseudomonadota bacterium]